MCEGGSVEAVGFHTSGFHLVPLKGHQKFGSFYTGLCLYVYVKKKDQRSDISTVTTWSDGIGDVERLDFTLRAGPSHRRHRCLTEALVFKVGLGAPWWGGRQRPSTDWIER